MTKLTSGKTYVYLARNLMPAQADAMMEKITPLFDVDHRDAVVTERQDLRQYPDGSASAALVGGTDYDGNGLSGIEAKFDTKLAGKDGDRVVDVDARHMIIPGSARDEKPAVDGMDVSLTIDSDLQYTTLNMLTQAVEHLAGEVRLRGDHAGGGRPGTGDGLLRAGQEPQGDRQPGGHRRVRTRLGEQGRHLRRRPGEGPDHADHRAQCRRVHPDRRHHGA